MRWRMSRHELPIGFMHKNLRIRKRRKFQSIDIYESHTEKRRILMDQADISRSSPADYQSRRPLHSAELASTLQDVVKELRRWFS